jgi:hypothetical protein
MGMSDKKILSLLDGYDAKLKTLPVNTLPELKPIWDKVNHAIGMIPKMRVFLEEGRREKAFRWLGFLQGVFWALNVYTVEELANHSRPSKKDISEQYEGHSFDAFGCSRCSVTSQHQAACIYAKEYLEAPVDAFPIQ